MQTAFTPVAGLIGGALIGLAAVLLMIANGRVAGVSGILGALLDRPRRGDVAWRLAFLAGLWLGVLVYRLARPEAFEVQPVGSWPAIVAAGLLVGFGTRLGSGCTSGHGVCGIARLSKRSIVATLVFMLTGFATVFVARHVIS